MTNLSFRQIASESEHNCIDGVLSFIQILDFFFHMQISGRNNVNNNQGLYINEEIN